MSIGPTRNHPLNLQNRFLLYENNYLRNVNNLLTEIDQKAAGKPTFAEPGKDQEPGKECAFNGGDCIPVFKPPIVDCAAYGGKCFRPEDVISFFLDGKYDGNILNSNCPPKTECFYQRNKE